MAESKKIIFEGVDKGVSSFYDKIQKRASEANNSIIRDAKKHSESLKEQLRFMEDSIKAIEKQNNLYEKQQRLLLQGGQQRELAGARTQSQKDEISASYSQKFSGLKEDSNSDKTIVTTLKQMLEVSKEQLRIDNSQEHIKKQEQAQINDRWEAQRSLWEQEAKEDKDGVRSKISRARSSNFAGMSQHDKDKLTYQENIVGDPAPKQKGVFKDVLAANLVADAIKNIMGGLGQVGSSLAGAQDDTKFMGALYGGIAGAIPFMSGIAPSIQQAKDREENAKKEQQMSRLKTRMTTGANVGSAVGLGLTGAEANEYALQIATAQGSNKGLNSGVRNLTGLKYGYGLDDSDIMGQLSTGRMTGTGGGQNIANVINAMKRSGAIKGNDYTQLSEMLGTQDSLARESAQNKNSPDANMITGIVSTFAQIGGQFKGERASPSISKINSALQNPTDDFNRAQNFAALSALPEAQGASYFDMIQMEAKGLEQEGFFGQRLKQMQEQTGGGDDLSLAIMEGFGLNPDAAEDVRRAFEVDPTRFDEMSFKDNKSIEATVAGRVGEMGTSGVSRYEVAAADIEQSFSNGAADGVLKAAEYAGAKFSKTLMDAFVDALGGKFKEDVKTVNQDIKKNKVIHGVAMTEDFKADITKIDRMGMGAK